MEMFITSGKARNTRAKRAEICMNAPEPRRNSTGPRKLTLSKKVSRFAWLSQENQSVSRRGGSGRRRRASLIDDVTDGRDYEFRIVELDVVGTVFRDSLHATCG